MPQPISGNQVLLDPAQPSPFDSGLMPAPIQVDSYADRLMDDLFDDVDKLLSGSVPPAEPVRVALPKPLNVAASPTAPIIARPSLPQWNLVEPRTPEVVQPKKSIKRSSHRLQKLLTIAFGASAIAAASMWLAQRGSVQRFFAIATRPQAVATASQVPVQDTNPQFAQYLRRSLDVLDRKAAGKANLYGSLPVAPIGSNPRSDSTKSPVVISVPPVPATPVVALSKSPAQPDMNQVLTRLSTVLEKLSINPNRSTPMGAIQSVQTPVSIEPQRSLRGIAIASDPSQSAVLFEMNGVTQRYYIGESIGSSGWSVVDISNNYVSVRRNGEVRSISIGQKL